MARTKKKADHLPLRSPRPFQTNVRAMIGVIVSATSPRPGKIAHKVVAQKVATTGETRAMSDETSNNVTVATHKIVPKGMANVIGISRIGATGIGTSNAARMVTSSAGIAISATSRIDTRHGNNSTSMHS